jgi:acetyltransferase-like isoleucine patch superfamily enzyme
MSSTRGIVKRTVFAAAFVAVLPLLVLVVLERWLTKGEGIFLACAQLLALGPGAPGRFLRGAFYYGALEQCHWEVHIGFGTCCTHRAVRLARNVSTGSYCLIGHADIAEGVRLASRVSITSGRRQHLDDEGRLSAVMRFERVGVGAGSWIGEAAVVSEDVGAHSIVSAGAVVIHSIPDAVIAGGNPAKVLKRLAEPDTD